MTGTVVRTSARMATPTTISPKVSWPAITQAIVGLVLVIVFAVTPGSVDHDTRQILLYVGLGLLGGSGATAGIGYNAPPGQVVVRDRND